MRCPGEHINDARPAEEGIFSQSNPGDDNTYAPLEGFINSQGLVDHRRVPFCFLNRGLNADFLD